LSNHRRSGRRRAGAAPATGRPRDAHRRRSRRRGGASGSGALSVLAQQVAVAAAVSGLALTAALPTPAAGPAASATTAPPGTEVHAAETARIDFVPAALGGSQDFDTRLKAIVAASHNQAAPAAVKGSLSAPLASLRGTSGFGYRVSPMTGLSGELHSGQDFSAACGTVVTAAAAGTVTFAAWHPYGGGNRVVVDHGNGLETTYNHLSLMDVAEGEPVERGSGVGQSGSTGASTGCHLHFEVMVSGRPVDPLSWL
jgi:murein DD-endopeptidase MepM/ murein hydrolase activator NlpD